MRAVAQREIERDRLRGPCGAAEQPNTVLGAPGGFEREEPIRFTGHKRD